MKLIATTCIAALATAALATPAVAQVEVTSNGGFEAGDTSDWVSFPTPNSTFTATSDAASGSFAGQITNSDAASAAVVKQANLAIGQVTPGATVEISFDSKGTFAAGGVSFAEFFSEIDGGGTSSAQILGGAPLFQTATYQTYTFTTTAGPDVSGGITLQFTATTGGDANSFAEVFIDNVSVRTVPEPASLALLGLGGVAALARRRRATA